jgi:hypothetical protein
VEIGSGDVSGCLVVGLAAFVHVQEAVDVIVLYLEEGFVLRFYSVVDLVHFGQSVLEQEVVDVCEEDCGVLESVFKGGGVEEFGVVLLELFDSDGGLVLIYELMGSAGIIGVVFEDGQIHRWQSQFGVRVLQPVFDPGRVVVVEGEGPNDGVEVVPLFEYVNALGIKLFVFEFPEDEFEVEDVAVEYVLVREVLQDDFVYA